jgi:hypothetical protein
MEKAGKLAWWDVSTLVDLFSWQSVDVVHLVPSE